MNSSLGSRDVLALLNDSDLDLSDASGDDEDDNRDSNDQDGTDDDGEEEENDDVVAPAAPMRWRRNAL